MTRNIRIEKPSDSVALVALSRPERLNALDQELFDRLPETFERLADDRSVRAVVLTGDGRGFCAGADLDSEAFSSTGVAEDWIRQVQRSPVLLRRLPQPSIAAVNGPAVGAGLGLALACDIRFASEQATFSTPFVRMGLVPDFGVSYFLPRVVGSALALDMLLGGRVVKAQEALALGLVSRVCDDALAAALETAETLAAMPPRAAEITREMIYRSPDLDLETAILVEEARNQAAALDGPEFSERFAAWREQATGSR